MKNRLLGHRRFNFDLVHESTPLTEGVFDANIDVSVPGSIRITLWNEWQAMLKDLKSVGPLWYMVRNGLGVLAVQGSYPELTFSPDFETAHASDAEGSISCRFRCWRQARAFDSGCCCGRNYGFEIENGSGEIFHRICLAKGADLASFSEWIQLHQATGLEGEGGSADGEESFLPDFSAVHCLPRLGALALSPELLRKTLIAAAQAEIPLRVGVATEGMTQKSHLLAERAMENHGWLVLSGNRCSLYVQSEPQGKLVAERKSIAGESIWSLSLRDPQERGVVTVQAQADHQNSWNRIVQECLADR